MNPAPISTLGEFCSTFSTKEAPPEIASLASCKILDSLACAYLGSASEVVNITRRLVRRLPEGPSTALFNGAAVSAADAAFVNSAAIHSILQDDVDLAIGHPACNVIPAALAVGETVDAAGSDVLPAIIVGYEAMWRIGGRGIWMIPTITRGFRGNAILGAFGSAAASARVLGLDPTQTANAIAAAASFASALLAPLNAGTMERAFQQAHNAQAGVTAALLAADGLDAHHGVLRGAGGFYHAFMGEDIFPNDAMEGLGDHFYLTESYSKPYPSAGSNTVGIAVLDHLLTQSGLRGANIARMKVEVLPRFTGKPGYPAISTPGPFTTVEEALISFPFELACLATLGSVTLPTLTRALALLEVTKLARRIDLDGVEVPYPLWCRITVEDLKGQVYVATSEEIDWRHFYLDKETATEKFRGGAKSYLPDSTVADIVDVVLNFDARGSVRDLTSLLQTAEFAQEPQRRS